VPSNPVATKKARGLLPAEVPHADAAFNAGRAALLTMALTENPELLFIATEDKLHQDYRRSAMVESHKLVQKLRAAGHAAVISGAGPTVLVLATSNVSAAVAEIAGAKFEVHPLGVSKRGAHQVAMDS
jgi:homoserine kinase